MLIVVFVQKLKTIIPLKGVVIEKQYRVLGMRALFRLITRFICAVWDAQCNTEESPKVMIKNKICSNM